MTHLCAHCGGRVADDAERCPSCGSAQRVSPAPRPAEPAEPSPPAAPVPATPPGSLVGKAALLGGLGFLVCGAGTLLLSAPLLLNRGKDAPATSVAVATPVATPSVIGGFAALRARGALRVAADPDAAPFLARAGEGWEGFEYGVMSALAAEVGVPLEIVPVLFSELDDAVRDGRADLAIGQMSPSSAYEGVAFSVSYLQHSLCLVVPARSSVKGLADLRGKRVGMYDDPVASQVTALGVGASYERIVFEDYGYFDELDRGGLDAVVYDCPLVRWEMRSRKDRLRIVDDALNVSTYSVAARATDPTLVADVNRVLRNLGDQGLLARLEGQWLGQAAPTEGYRTATGRVVVLRRGDTLRTVAARELGDEARWTELRDKNRDLVGDDPDGVYAGLRLRLP